MKRAAVAALLIAALFGIVLLFGGNGGGQSEYLRVHIRADSNAAEAQAVKYKVRDRVVDYLTPVVAECETKAQALEEVQERLAALEEVAEEVLRENGYDYGARASLRREEFPTRVYREVTLEAGVYDALIIELGSGKGDNWWCVVYPPLCFTGSGGNIVYKSKIAELIRRFFS